MSIFQIPEVNAPGNLELLANQVVEGFIVGLHKSPFHGFSVEFAEHRLYNPGESTRHIDWRVYGRTNKLFTKKYEEETNLRCQIAIDCSSSMYFPQKDKNKKVQYSKIEFASLAAASIMNLLKKQRDAFGLDLFDEEIRLHTQCKSQTSHYKLLISYLEAKLADQTPNRQTAAAAALHELAEKIHRRSLVIIFSDMFDHAHDSEELFSALQHLKHNKHEVVLFHVMDKSHEMDFEYSNRPHLFIDLESGENIRLQPALVKEHYQTQMKQFMNKLRQHCLQYKIDLVEADIAQGFYPILQSYMIKRNRMQ
ncbi:MAG: DUF58 domain-containing protein [Saprospiraceae bacterium]